MTVNDNARNMHRRGRWHAALLFVALTGLAALTLTRCGNSAAPGTHGVDSLNACVRMECLLADSLLHAGMQAGDDAWLLFLQARAAISRADSLAAAGATATVDTTLRTQTDRAIAASRQALMAADSLFADMPRYHEDLQRRIAATDSAIARYNITPTDK